MIYLNWATMFVPLKAKGFRLSLIGENGSRWSQGRRHSGQPRQAQSLEAVFRQGNSSAREIPTQLKDPDAGKEFNEECVSLRLPHRAGTRSSRYKGEETFWGRGQGQRNSGLSK